MSKENNATQTTNSKLGGNTMKNTIKENRIAAAAAKEAERKAQDEATRLAGIAPVDIVGTMTEVTQGIAHSYRNESGYAIGTNGGKLVQEPITLPDGTPSTIAAESQEALDALKANIAEGLSGDGKFHKLITVHGIPCDCVGSTPEELEADIAAAKDYYQAHINGSVIRDIDVAEQLVDAEFKPEDLEQITIDGSRFILSYDGNYIMNLDGETIVNLDNLKSVLSREDVKTLLTEKLEAWIKEQEELAAQECDWDDDDDEYWDDDEDYIDDDEDEEEDDDDDDDDISASISIKF